MNHARSGPTNTIASATIVRCPRPTIPKAKPNASASWEKFYYEIMGLSRGDAGGVSSVGILDLARLFSQPRAGDPEAFDRARATGVVFRERLRAGTAL